MLPDIPKHRVKNRWNGLSWLGQLKMRVLRILAYSEGLQVWGRESVVGSLGESLMSSLSHLHPSHNFSSSRELVFVSEL